MSNRTTAPTTCGRGGYGYNILDWGVGVPPPRRNEGGEYRKRTLLRITTRKRRASSPLKGGSGAPLHSAYCPEERRA